MKKVEFLASFLHINWWGGFVKFIFVFLASFSLFAGVPTLKTIVVDGNPSDWAEVLANPIQVTIDGDGSSMRPEQCSTLSSDRDCPVGSNGRDLNTFAWTFDNTYIYIYQTRFGSTSNVQDFWFYMDTNRDQMMGNSDFVLRINYKGTNRDTYVELYYYLQNGSDPDPMVDSNGYADGYTVIGYVARFKQYGNLRGGFSDGKGFETRVPWADLGVPAGTGIFYHVSSSNGTNIPGQIDDNCGGPDGGIGAFGFYLLDIFPDRVSGSISPNTKNYTHTIKNTGTFNETIDFKVSSTLGFSLSLYNSENTLIATDSLGDGDFIDTEDYLNPSFDSNNNLFPDVTLIPDGTFNLILSISIPENLQNTMDETKLTGWIEGENISDYVTDKTYIGDIQTYPPLKLSGVSNSSVDFAHTLIHYLAPDIITLRVFQTRNWEISLYYDISGDGTGDILMAKDLNGDGDFVDSGDYLNPSFDSNSDNFPDTGTLSYNTPFYFVISVKIPPSTPLQTENQINFYALTSFINDFRQASLMDILIVKERFEFIPEYNESNGNCFYGAAGLSSFFPHSISNNAYFSDIANLSYSASHGATVVFWSDPDCDGSISDGSMITNTGTIPPNGGRVCIVMEVKVPAGITKGTIVSIQVTATSQKDPNYSVSLLDEIKISLLVPYEDEIYSRVATKFTHCQILYVKGFNFWPSQTYYLKYLNPNNQEKENETKIGNGNGQFMGEYYFLENDLAGLWKTRADDGSNIWDEILITLEPNGNANSISPFYTNKSSYNLTANITINLTLNNTNSGSDYNNSKLKAVILNYDENKYWDGTDFSPYNGNQWSKTINPISVEASSSQNLSYTINNVNFPLPGVYKIKTKWEASCPFTIAEAEFTFLVGTTLMTYSDENFNVEVQSFNLHEPVYIAGNYYYPNSTLKLAFYTQEGNLIDISQANTNSSGYFSYIKDTTSWNNEGQIYICAYPSSSSPPPVYTPWDSNLLASSLFNLERLPGLLRNDQFPALGYSIFKNPYPQDPSLDPIADLEKQDFKSGESFPNEYNDLLPSSSYIIFYQLDKPVQTLRLTKESGKIVIYY